MYTEEQIKYRAGLGGKRKIQGCRRRIKNREWHLNNYKKQLANPTAPFYKENPEWLKSQVEKYEQIIIELNNELQCLLMEPKVTHFNL